MIAMDVRIIDQEGKNTHKGRVEVRNEGIWGTICASGIENKAAIVICKQIGFKEGKFLNPSDSQGKGFCSNFEGLNYCGVSASSVFFSHLTCQGNEKSISECYKQIADRGFCTHDYDTIIECSNTDSEENIIIEAGSIRLIDYSGNPSPDGIGRLEMLRGNWGTICNSRFTDTSAKVACIQMGYLDGKLYGQADSEHSCSSVKGLNYCGSFNQPIRMSEVQCDGNEKYFKECKSSIITASCTHYQDVVIKCEGLGDNTGRSQNVKKPKTINPLIEKLPMPPTFNAKCDSIARSIDFRGDPGSIFMVNCPSDCINNTATVIGIGLYSLDSSICRAAIHAGVINNEGGNVVLVKTYGQKKYYATQLKSVNSLESNYLKASFFITAENSAYRNMLSMINNVSSFLEYTANGKLEVPKFYTKYLYSSFIELDSDVKALFEWISPQEMQFDGGSVFVDLYQIETSRIILEKKTFTMFTKIRLEALTDTSQTIFSIGGCDGFSVIIDKQSELIFDVQCGSHSYKSGIYIPLNYNTHISIVFEGSKLMFYLDGNKFNDISCYFNLHYKQKITIGKNSEYDKDYFKGQVFFLAFFGEPLGVKSNQKIFTDGYLKPEQVKKLKFMTLDERNCISSCVLLPMPGLPGSPSPPPEAISYNSNGNKTIIPFDSSNSNLDMNPFKEIKCETTGTELFYGDIKIGDRIRIKCPSDCSNSRSIIYGTFIYSIDSAVCLAATHTGLKELPMLLVEILPSSSYQGTFQYGIQSTSIDMANYSFSVKEAPPVKNIDCKTSAAAADFGGIIGTKYLVNCPFNCSKLTHHVFGNEVYSADSSICQAAIHSGSLNDRGGEVQFQIEPGRKLYFSHKAFGIDSKERDSYVKSIKFFNTNNRLYIKFQDDFKSQPLSKNWDIIDNLEAVDYPSKWEYVESPDKSPALHQGKRIRTDSPLSYGSMLMLKNADVVNSLYKISLFFISLSPVGIIFRYKDNNNYYHLRINNSGPYKLTLDKRYEGRSTTIANIQNISITARLWYTFTITTYYDQFQIYLQIGDLRNDQLIADFTDNDIQRGSLGLATDGNEDFYAKGIYVDDFDINKSHLNSKAKSDARSFENILHDNTETHRSKYCKTIYNEVHQQSECKEYHNYCEKRCNDSIHTRENILNFTCQRQCVKDAQMREKIANLQMSENVGFGISNQVWSPKEKEKCDYKPDEFGAFWVPCYINEVKNNVNDPEQKYLQIKFKVSDLVKIVNLLYPNISVKQCGAALKGRDDCEKKTDELPSLT
jgi:hypothetical protein